MLRIPTFPELDDTDTPVDVRLAQEMLVLDGYGVKIDGVWGPVCREALRLRYQKADSHLLAHRADFADWAAWMVLHYRPRELPSNRGPWVRCFMPDGSEDAWCVGFATGLVNHYLQTAMYTFAPDNAPVSIVPWCKHTAQVAEWAEHNKAWLTEPEAGGLGLVKSSGGYSHAFIVGKTQDPNVLLRIEGNSNHAGSIEGTEACLNFRPLNKDAYQFLRAWV